VRRDVFVKRREGECTEAQAQQALGGNKKGRSSVPSKLKKRRERKERGLVEERRMWLFSMQVKEKLAPNQKRRVVSILRKVQRHSRNNR